jgi:peptidoglycan/LPS O-acetylase OafA/YrhL
MDSVVGIESRQSSDPWSEALMRPQIDGAPSAIGTQLAYMPSLDGIRALAVLAVMANHGGFPWARGGLLGVNAFFVLSGFLITQLLLKEWSRTGTVRLRSFWARRARRLLPALVLLLAVIGLFVESAGAQGSQPLLFGDAVSTLFYFNNWHQIIQHQSYFAQVSAVSPLLHTWSLAIEEQFYLVWPMLVLVVLKLWRSTKTLLTVAIVGAVASAIEMGLLFNASSDPTRVYFGTDTRAQDILVGAALGILLLNTKRSGASRRAQLGWSAVALVAAAVFAWDWSQTQGNTAFPYRGGFFLADVTVALVICGATFAPSGLAARVLSFGPLRFVGWISYGLYLWHWPIDLLVNHARTGLDGYGLFAVRVALTFVVATLSWTLIEMPIRRMTFRTRLSWAWVPAGALVVTGVLIAMSVVPAGTGPISAPMAATAVDKSSIPAPVQREDDSAGAVPSLASVEREAYYASTFPDQENRLKVLFVGDSLSLYVGYDMAPYAARYGITIGGRSMSGCGLATVEPHNIHGTPSYSLAPCATWPTLWQADVDQLHPDVVVVVLGWWDAMDRIYQGSWQHLGEPTFDEYETSQFERAVSILSSRGARVALMTAPYFDTGEQLDGQPWDEDAPARVDVLNQIITQVAAEHPGVVSVVPLNKYLDPNGHFTWTIDGQVMRLSDGVHTTPAAGPYLAPKILPQLAAIGRGDTTGRSDSSNGAGLAPAQASSHASTNVSASTR